MKTSVNDKGATKMSDLVDTRKCLRLLLSALTCGVFAVALFAVWVASAVTAREVNNAELVTLRAEAAFGVSLTDARQLAVDGVLDAFAAAADRRAAFHSTADFLPSGSAPDSAVEISSSVQTPFSVLVFEDGAMTFSMPPTNVLADESGHAGAWSKRNVAKLVEGAIAVRAEGDRHMPPQYVKIGDMTWQWTTWVMVVNPDAAAADEGVTFYPSGKLEDYVKDGCIAARLFTFSDITPSVRQLERLAMILAGTGVAGCALLVFVCRKTVDRVLDA